MSRKKRNKAKKAAATPAPEPSSGISSRFRFFLWMSGFFALATVFLRMDVITVWPGAEGWALDAALGGGTSDKFFLPAWINGQLSALLEPFYLGPRLLSGTFLVATAMLFYHWGKRLFGQEAVRLTLLAAAASLWLPFFGKVATADSWALLGHTGLFLSTLLLARDGRKKYAYYYAAFAAFSALAAPLSSLILVIGIALFHYRRGLSKGNGEIIGGTIGIVTVSLLSAGLPENMSYYFLGDLSLVSYGTFLLYAFFGALPQVGWWLAAQRDFFFRLKKQDTLAKSVLPFILFGLLAQSLVVVLVWSLLTAKQMQHYFAERYPWKSWVRGGAILQLIFAFFAAFFGLLAGLAAFSGEGYRAALGMVAAYWIFSLLGVIGLYGMKRDFAIGGTILTGILGMLFFWTQVYPYLETQRDWPQQAIEHFELKAGDQFQLTSPESGFDQVTANGLPYFRAAGLIDATGLPEDQVLNPQQITVRPIMTRDSLVQANQFFSRIVVRGIVVEE